MSDAYDDRIFALSSIMASVLVYNLPETVKEGDIEKLSFALELAREFSSRTRDAPALARLGPPPPTPTTTTPETGTRTNWRRSCPALSCG